ncbi:hydantoinase B/oxoprolinase family protein [Novosphingobium taihuense]|uniref:5-oxoprolinase (ATP-hydrolyzing) n=1 Tax=Novosphingobium taihuense TaxID=260085 RepID=A0A7W7AAU2_9SPHN|nr:hydantoinase B/oxoprolinase family protein [Novosphingobium taihuense]MBB4613613.1 5-oxoprolinase (ATP-hydrolyzing) [Novosphingobium taihuense]TWH81144.1 5-oxoprolinase (ATP-hydrolysing) [Novosphingobium taihuense]
MTCGDWKFWVDRGGTFTDVVAIDPAGKLHRTKLLSEDPGRYGDAAVEAMRRLTGTFAGPLPRAELRLGTTVATNALLERKGEPVLLAITRGFGDSLRIGTQERPDIFARRIDLPKPLACEVLEIVERVRADGTVELVFDEAHARAGLQAAYNRGLRAIAIVLMHGWNYPAHERALASIAREIGFSQISVSHEVAPLIRLISRGDTTVADAYLSPVLDHYIAGLTEGLGPDVSALFMQSGGGLADAASFRGKDAVLSGPAGGIVGMAATARAAGFDAVVGFDMGGTSTDVSWFSGRYERESEARVAGVRLRVPMMRIHTVAAGGGSICRFDGTRLIVGPESAGAVPGPASYRRDGPLALTDCNVLLGKLQPAHFPHVFGPSGREPLSRDAVAARFATLCEEITAATGQAMAPEQVAEGFLAIAVANMANAIKAVSVRRGHDVTRATLACFGGAGGQHACLVADALGIDTIQCHPLASVLSAYGMGLADRRAIREASLGVLLDAPGLGEAQVLAARLAKEATSTLGEASHAEVTLNIRPKRSESVLEVPIGPLDTIRTDFAKQWQSRFGFAVDDDVVIDSLRVEAILPSAHAQVAVAALPLASGAPIETVVLHTADRPHDAPLWRREDLATGSTVVGPALIVDPVSTIVVEPEWQARVDAIGNLILTRTQPRAAKVADHTALDPVRLEVMGGLFMAVAEEMGAALQHSARSVNIRERLDFSCALFDRAGNLIANAPHMPVHLGSMGESVRTILSRRSIDGRGIRRGDAYVLNAPYDGGTHLPDVTVVMPVFTPDDRQGPAWFVAARGHHADIGGIAPGSMPPDSRTLDDEGVLLDNVLLVDEGRLCEAELRSLLASGPHPSRAIDLNIADLKAQLAACTRGSAELVRLAAEQGRATVDAYMAHVQDHAERAVRALIGRLSDGAFTYAMDNGAKVSVAVTFDRDKAQATIDFTGSSPQLTDNFNAPLPVVRAAVLYVVRCLIDDAVPMNEGCLRPIRLIVPEASMLHPRAPAAVVAGNVETSQVVTDALFGALGAMAAAQGTMNNFTFGNERHQYYETIAGGSGAGPDFDGASVVQTHMTNSRLTDPEVLETRFPVLIEAFAIRQGSGGKGAYRGGDGAIRRVRFLEAMDAGILANRRVVPPFGLAGGGAGACGINRIERADGTVEVLPATASANMEPGDVFVIESPGGGGYGKT